MDHLVRLATSIALLLICSYMAACETGSDAATVVPTNTPEPTPTIQPADLEGTLWKLDSFLNSQGELIGVLPNTEITMEFTIDGIGGSAGCNHYFASYEINGNSLIIGQIGSTLMACVPDVMEQEAGYLAALESVASFRVADDRLEMMNGDGATVLAFSALEPTPLVGTNWSLTGYNNGKGGFASVLTGAEITAAFGDDGSLTGSAGCNNYSASYEVEGENLSVGPTRTTRMMCAEPEGIMDQENAYLAAPERVATFRIKGTTLELFDADGTRMASYTSEMEIGLANPASVHCEEQGGTVEIRAEAGGEAGYCVFADGSECEEWAFFRGECTPEGSPSLTSEALENAIYRSDWPEDGVAQLTDGEYRKPLVEGSATELIILLADLALGDLDGDGVEDAAVILVTDPGGSGTFYDLAAVLNRDGKPEHVATASLGDRAKIRAFSIGSGQVTVEMVTHGPDDPMCCPTQIVRNTYALEGETLTEVASEVIGSVEETGEAEIPAELLGTVWLWQEYVDTASLNDITVDDPSQYTLEFLPDGTYRIQADCNQGSGRYTVEGSRLSLEPGPMTMAACGPESLDGEFLSRLGDVVIYVLEEGKLYLNLKMDAGNMVLTSETETESSGVDITGIVWKWQRFGDTSDQNNIDVDDPDKYTLILNPDGTYEVKADCNLSGGGYELDGNRLTLLPGPTTIAECQPGSLYDEYLARLGDVVTYVLDEGRLVLNLKADAGNMIFVPAEDAASAADIADVEWQWSGLVETEPATQSVVPHPENYTLVFQPDGFLGIQADCNRVSGSFILEGNALTFELGPLVD